MDYQQIWITERSSNKNRQLNLECARLSLRKRVKKLEAMEQLENMGKRDNKDEL